MDKTGAVEHKSQDHLPRIVGKIVNKKFAKVIRQQRPSADGGQSGDAWSKACPIGVTVPFQRRFPDPISNISATCLK